MEALLNSKYKKFLVRGLVLTLILTGMFYFYLAEQRFRSPTGVTATVKADVLYLKSGPGVLFERLGHYPRWTDVRVLGQAFGGDWLNVATSDGKQGWMAKEFLFVNGDVTALPNSDLRGIIPVIGLVTDSLQNPVAGVALSFTPGDSDPNLAFTVHTDAGGHFFAYFPAQADSKWTIQVAGLDCSAPVVDSQCEVSQYYLAPRQAEVTIPPAEPPAFVYHAATAFIQGVVHDANGQLVAGIRVTGYQADGAVTTGITSRAGQFRLPAAEGQWEISTLQAGQSSATLQVSVGADGSEQLVELIVP